MSSKPEPTCGGNTPWPPKNAEAKTLYFHADGGLSFEAPTTESAPFDEYVSDPAKPVPYVSYAALDVPQEYMLSDQRFASSRTDVLTYETPVLEQDVTIAGPLKPHLFVSTTGTDSDFDVKLIDVYPTDYPDSPQDARHEDKPRKDVPAPAFAMGGYQQLVRGEPFRGKFRHSFEKPEPFTPGKVEEINFTIQDINHTFRRGHRIMVQVQSSWFPLTDRNPQTFVNIPDAKPADFVKATERVYHTKTEPSGIAVGVILANLAGEYSKIESKDATPSALIAKGQKIPARDTAIWGAAIVWRNGSVTNHRLQMDGVTVPKNGTALNLRAGRSVLTLVRL